MINEEIKTIAQNIYQKITEQTGSMPFEKGTLGGFFDEFQVFKNTKPEYVFLEFTEGDNLVYVGYDEQNK